MNILYIANLRLPTEKAYGLQIVKMCEAFANLDLHTTLLVPSRNNQIKKSIFEYYNVKGNFTFKKAWSPDFYWPGILDKVAVTIKSFISAIVLAVCALNDKADIFYSRDEGVIFTLSFFAKPRKLVFEAHKFSGVRL